jgi:hypothetical protein
LLKLAQERFKHERRLRESLANVSERLEERKQVDRAKGLLMRARQLHEDEAFTALRSVAMRSGLRIGEVARRACLRQRRGAADVNRSGPAAHAQSAHGQTAGPALCPVAPGRQRGLLGDTIQHTEDIVHGLARDPPGSRFRDLVDKLMQAWKALRQAVQGEPTSGELASIDSLAEEMLLRADVLTAALETATGAGTLRVVNVCGRQRMLSQRVAKHALLATLLPSASATHCRAAAIARGEFEGGVAYLQGFAVGRSRDPCCVGSGGVAVAAAAVG